MSLSQKLDLLRVVSFFTTLLGFYLAKKGIILETGLLIYFVLVIPLFLFGFSCIFPFVILWGEDLLIYIKKKRNKH